LLLRIKEREGRITKTGAISMKIPRQTGAIERYAVRILFILYFCRDYPLPGAIQLPLETFDQTSFWRIDSETKLQKIDFWVRYPDHFSMALLHLLETNPQILSRKEEIKDVVRRIFQDNEPIIRWVPMRKYLRGAYEPLDNVMVFLSSRSLAYRRIEERGRRNKYYLTPKGKKAVESIMINCAEAKWYVGRCQLINSFFEHLNGFEIRNIQYLDPSYAQAPNLATIETAELQVRKHFEQIYGMSLKEKKTETFLFILCKKCLKTSN
jgi:hypothetical protein